MTTIQKIEAWEILDSRGFPTIAVEVQLISGHIGYASVPSGASTGSREALELRDQDPKRYFGKGVLNAVKAITEQMAPALVNQDIPSQAALDEHLIALDGTPNKSRFGANAILAISLAFAKAHASEQRIPLYHTFGEKQPFCLPVPLMNIINGGAHADNPLDIQECMIIPLGMPSFSESMRCGVEIFQHLKRLLHQEKLNTGVGDEGGFAPDLPVVEVALDKIMTAIEAAGYRPGRDVYLGLDVASSELYEGGRYHLKATQQSMTSSVWCQYLEKLVANYPIISVEDGMAEDDWDGWALLTEALGRKIQLVGDDLFVTNTQWLKKGIDQHIANAILIKPNQIGTLTETVSAIRLAQHAKYNVILSHRSGETADTTIADLAVGTHAGQIKTGSLCRSERLAKYNRLLQIEQTLKGDVYYAGNTVFSTFLSYKQRDPSTASI